MVAESRQARKAKSETRKIGARLGFKRGFEDEFLFPAIVRSLSDLDPISANQSREFYRDFVKVAEAASDFNARILWFLEKWRAIEPMRYHNTYPAPLYEGKIEFRHEPFPHVFVSVPEIPPRMTAKGTNLNQVKKHWQDLVWAVIRDFEVPMEARFAKAFVYVQYRVLDKYGAGADADNYPTRFIINALKFKLIRDDSWDRMGFGVGVVRVEKNPSTDIYIMDHGLAMERLFAGKNPTDSSAKSLPLWWQRVLKNVHLKLTKTLPPKAPKEP